MKRIAVTGSLLVVMVVLVALQPGCSLTQTASEHMHTYDRDVYHDVRLIPDDWDMFWMLDRPTRLSRWLITY